MLLNSISVLTQIYVFPDYNASQTWEQNAVNDLMKHGFITNDDYAKIGRKFKVTEKGKFYVEYIEKIKCPVQYWAIP